MVVVVCCVEARSWVGSTPGRGVRTEVRSGHRFQPRANPCKLTMPPLTATPLS